MGSCTVVEAIEGKTGKESIAARQERGTRNAAEGTEGHVRDTEEEFSDLV